MNNVNGILHLLYDFCPLSLAESWDNCGLLVGDKYASAKKVLVALDVTLDVIEEAITNKCQVIIAHHPMIFTSIKSIRTDEHTGKIIYKAIQNGISIICMHTNLDVCDGGVNDALAKTLNIQDIQNLCAGEHSKLGRFGTLPKPMPFEEFLKFTKSALNANGLRYSAFGDVHKVCVIGGSGGKLIDYAYRNGCDTIVTSDISYDCFQYGKLYDLNIIDAGHFATENVVCQSLANYLSPHVECIISNHSDIINFF